MSTTINRINIADEYKALNDMLRDMLKERNKKISYLTERVQELESELQSLSGVVSEVSSREIVTSEQNKRYREVLSYVVEIDCIDWDKKELSEMARQALEYRLKAIWHKN